LAGGHTLLPTMKLRLAAPKALVDLSRVAELRGIEKRGNALVIGATTTHAEVADSATVKSSIAGLAALAGGIGDPHVRHRGTIGGSVANNDPAADYPAALLALGATVATNRREIKADAFFSGLFSTSLQDGEIITRISFPVPAKFAYAKFANPASRYALVGVAVAQTGGAARVAVTGAGSKGAFRHAAMEAALARDWSAAVLNGIATDAKDMVNDIHGDAAYRAHLVGVMARRAVAAAG
jgi:carbon-monoxide dehydrogenase medium subunit